MARRRAALTQLYEIGFENEEGRTHLVKIKLSETIQWEAAHRKDWLENGASTIQGQSWVVWKACQRLNIFAGTLEEFQNQVTDFNLVVTDDEDDLPFPM